MIIAASVSLAIFVVLTISLTTIVVRYTPLTTLSEHQRECLVLLRAFQNVCRDYDIKYWATGGTFLGAVRDGRMIEWDDDIDVEMKATDVVRLRRLRHEINAKYGLHVKYSMVGSPLRVSFKRWQAAPFIDIFAMNDDGTYAASVDRMRWPRCRHTPPIEIRDVPFGEDMTIPVPTSLSYLDNCYGDWRKKKAGPSHLFAAAGRPSKVRAVIPLLSTFVVLTVVALVVLVWSCARKLTCGTQG